MAVLLATGFVLTGCGGSPSATPATTAPSTVSSAPYAGTALSWLSTKARPWNKTLNDDQAVVVTASRATAEGDSGTYFARLAAACTRLHGDALEAEHVQTAPAPALASVWHSMTVHTGTYASDCLALTRTHSSASLTRWDQSLNAMNTANAALNAAVAAVRSQAGYSEG